MSKTLHALLQALGFAVQVVNAASGLVPSKFQPLVAALAAAGQAVLALSNHPNAVPTSPEVK